MTDLTRKFRLDELDEMGITYDFMPSVHYFRFKDENDPKIYYAVTMDKLGLCEVIGIGHVDKDKSLAEQAKELYNQWKQDPPKF